MMLLSGESRPGLTHHLDKSQSGTTRMDGESGSSVKAQENAGRTEPFSLTGNSQYQSLSSMNDEMRVGDVLLNPDQRRGSTQEATSSPSASPQPRSRIPKSSHSPYIAPTKPHNSQAEQQQSRQQASQEDSASEGPFKPIYPYPENKDVIVWKSRDPRTAMTTTISTLDPRSNTDSRSKMSQTRRIMDQRVKERQMELQRDLSGHSARKPLPESFKNSIGEGNRKGIKIAADDATNSEGSRRSSQRNSSAHHPFPESTSPTTSPTRLDHKPLLPSSASKSNQSYSRDSFDKTTSSRKQLARVLSGPIFVSNPRGIAPTPSPDASLELVSSPSIAREKQSRQVQERMRRYEAQLDQRIQLVQANNRRLLELKLLLEGQDQAMVVRAQEDFDDDEEEWMEDQRKREKDRAQLEEATILLEESQVLQQQMREDLEQERSNNKDMDARIQGMSSQLKELLELSEAQTVELKQVRQQAVADREEWDRQLAEERHKQEELQSTVAATLTKKDRERSEETAKRASKQIEVRKLTADVTSLNRRIHELEDQMRLQEDKARAALSNQIDQVKDYQTQIQKLEEKLEMEQDRLSEDQEARTRVRVRVNELAKSVEQKEDEVQELRGMLEERDELLDRRQNELDDALSMVTSLEDQLRDQQAETQENQQHDQELHSKEIRQHRSELRDVKLKLTTEKESNRQLENRIQLLLESHQETSQISESKVQQLEEELNKRTVQLSQSSSTTSSATNTIHQLQLQIDDQERIILEKEDRIQELEQELKLAQQQAQSVIADLEQDVFELEGDRSKLETLLQKAHRQADEEQMKAKDLEIQLSNKDEDLHHDLNQRHEQERLLLERLLADMESTQVSEDQEDHRNGSLNNESDSADGSVQYFYSRLQDKIRELKLERLYQERALVELRQQLGQCDVEIETQRGQMMRMESDRKSLENELGQLQEDLSVADSEQHQLRQELQRRDSQSKDGARDGRGIPNGSVSKRMPHERRLSSSLSGQQQRHEQHRSQKDLELIKSLQSKIETLEDQITTIEQEKQQVLDQLVFTQDQLRTMDETIQDQGEAAKSIRAKYTDKIVALQREIVKHRKMVVKQESHMILYLSVIEKLKLQLRGAKVE